MHSSPPPLRKQTHVIPSSFHRRPPTQRHSSPLTPLPPHPPAHGPVLHKHAQTHAPLTSFPLPQASYSEAQLLSDPTSTTAAHTPGPIYDVLPKPRSAPPSPHGPGTKFGSSVKIYDSEMGGAVAGPYLSR